MFVKKIAISSIAIALTWLNLIASEEASDEHVVTLTKDTFKDFVEGEDFTIVKFYAPWCGHCKRLAPEYEAAAKALKEDNVKLAKVDVTVEQELGSQFDIKGYPTLKVFRRGVPEEYTGGRTTDTILQYVQRMTGPSIDEASSLADAKEKTKNLSVSFIGTFKSKTSEGFQIFQSVADSSRNAGKYFLVIDEKADENVVAFRSEEGLTHPIKVVSEEALSEFVKTEKFPLFGTIDTSNYAEYFSSGLSMMWFIGTESDFDAAASAVRQVAASFRKEALFVWLDASVFKEHAYNALGVSSIPALVAQIGEARYMYEENDFQSVEKIQTFCTNAFGGKLTRHLMTEPVPEQPADDPVLITVGQTLEKTVFTQDKDVFLEVYAPWCGHCKQFEKTYKEFADLMSKYPHVAVAKMDGTKNESPLSSIQWQGFPTIVFVKAGTTTPLTYEGPRTVQGLVDFLKKNGSKSIDDIEIPESKPIKDEL